jgi:hypothetical protein
MSRRRSRRLGFLLVALVLSAGALVAAALMKSPTTGAVSAEVGELPPALAMKLAKATPSVGGLQEGERSFADDEWMKHAMPGSKIASSVIENSTDDWRELSRRDSEGSDRWRPLGPTWAKGLPNPYRDRSVYNANTRDFSGRITQGVIDPNCGRGGDDDDDDDGGGGSCRLWIANAGGGVWRTNNALAREPKWKYLSMEFEHNSIGSLELDPNDRRANTLWAGTGENNGCASGCEAGVGIYKSRNGGERWSGPFGREHFYNRAVGSIEVKPGDSNTIFAASGRAVRGISNACCRGIDALIPGAPHFGTYRSTDGGNSWQLVHQGADQLCTNVNPDIVSQNQTPCSPRGARRVRIDPVDPNTVYVSYFARGIWRSRDNGATWQQIMAPIGNTAVVDNERAEFDLVKLPNGETRMYAGVGAIGGPAATGFARFRRNDNVRSAPAATVLASWQDMTNPTPDTPGYSSFNYCEPQCWYDNYVFAPATHFPRSGADHNDVYLLGDNEYSENNWGPASPRCCPENPATGRSNGRGLLLSQNGGEYFTDMTDDTTDDIWPVEIHPDHHAVVVNPRNYKQFFDLGDGGVTRSNGKLVNDSGDCVQPKGYQATRLAFCQLVLSEVPERLTVMNKGLRTLHFYQLNVNPHDPDDIVGGTQDNGSWEIGDAWRSGTNGPQAPPHSFGAPRTNCETDDDDDDDDGGNGNGNGGEQVWVNTNIADGGHNNFDVGDSCFRQTAFQLGSLMVHYEPKNQLDANWIADTLLAPGAVGGYGFEGVPFIGSHIHDPVHAHWLWTGREHVFRSTNQGRNPLLTKEAHRANCNIWYGDFDLDDDGQYEQPGDWCDDWRPLGDPGPNGALTSTFYGPDRIFPTAPLQAQQKHVAVVERAMDGSTLWAGTNAGRIFVSKNADNAVPTAVVFDRIDNDPTAMGQPPGRNSPPRYPTAIYVDPNDSNHAWITYSGFNAKSPEAPGHVFEVRYVPNASTFQMLDGNEPRDRMGDIPATSLTRTPSGWLYVGTDYGCVKSRGDGRWTECADGLPRTLVADLMYVRKRHTIYAATHGQGVWELDLDDDGDDD